MTWSQLLASTQEITLPWTGGRALHDRARSYRIAGATPPEHGWHRFEVGGSRRATWIGAGELDLDYAEGREVVRGYLVEQRLVPDGVHVKREIGAIFARSEPLWLVEPGLERFARVRAARAANGALVYLGPELPLGPEPEVLAAYQDRAPSIDRVAGVTPALHLAFLWHVRRRERAEARRREVERLAREEAERAARADVYRRATGSAVARRELAAVDFEAAARAALAVGGAELLDVRGAPAQGERVVQFRFRNRRFECVVHRHTLRVVDAGICLIDHATEERGDALFTLESLVAVIDEAIRTHQLVVFRHVG